MKSSNQKAGEFPGIGWEFPGVRVRAQHGRPHTKQGGSDGERNSQLPGRADLLPSSHEQRSLNLRGKTLKAQDWAEPMG